MLVCLLNHAQNNVTPGTDIISYNVTILPWGKGDTPQTFQWGVQCTPSNPYPISDQNDYVIFSSLFQICPQLQALILDLPRKRSPYQELLRFV